MERSAADGVDGVGAGEGVDADAALEGLVGPDAFDHYDARLQPVEQRRVEGKRAATVAEAHTRAVGDMLEKYDVVRSMYHGFDYMRGLAGTPQERLVAIAEAIEWILGHQHKAAEKETTEKARKKVHRRYQDEVLPLPPPVTPPARSATKSGSSRRVRAVLVKWGQALSPGGRRRPGRFHGLSGGGPRFGTRATPGHSALLRIPFP